MAKRKSKSSCVKCKNEMKTERSRLKRVTRRRRLQFLFENRRRLHCSREFRRRTLLNLLHFKASSTRWQMVPLRLLRLEPRLTLALLLVVVTTKTTSLT